ncbi:MAG: cytochrome c peroxidase, partial [Pirellulales bacterium]
SSISQHESRRGSIARQQQHSMCQRCRAYLVPIVVATLALGCSNADKPSGKKEATPKTSTAQVEKNAKTGGTPTGNTPTSDTPTDNLKPAAPNADPGPKPEPADDKPDDKTDNTPPDVAVPEVAVPKVTELNAIEAPDGECNDGAPAASTVLLGGPELTSGIPGEGPLTSEQISDWLDDPKNHEPLTVELPLGLSLGAMQMVGLTENPLTRAKIELGRQLYFDPRLSQDSTISCASCHDPDTGFAAPTQFGVGILKQTGNRNSPVAYNRILSGPQFWDGRAASLEVQAIGPIANPIEMGNTHEACVACLAGIEGYKMQFDKIFGELTIEAVGKAIASFERAIVTGPSAYDYDAALDKFRRLPPEDLEFLEQDDPAAFAEYQRLLAAAKKSPLSESAVRGKALYFSDKSRCATCHVGANFADEKYHNLGVGMDAKEPDLGRFAETKDDKDRGAFKTPTLRNVAQTAPYMHDGSQKTLEEVVEWYAKGGHPNDHLSDKIVKLELSEQDKKDLVEFMKALTGPLTPVARGRLP